MRGGVPRSHGSLVAKSKMMLILSLNALNCKRDNRLHHKCEDDPLVKYQKLGELSPHSLLKTFPLSFALNSSIVW